MRDKVGRSRRGERWREHVSGTFMKVRKWIQWIEDKEGMLDGPLHFVKCDNLDTHSHCSSASVSAAEQRTHSGLSCVSVSLLCTLLWSWLIFVYLKHMFCKVGVCMHVFAWTSICCIKQWQRDDLRVKKSSPRHPHRADCSGNATHNLHRIGWCGREGVYVSVGKCDSHQLCLRVSLNTLCIPIWQTGKCWQKVVCRLLVCNTESLLLIQETHWLCLWICLCAGCSSKALLVLFNSFPVWCLDTDHWGSESWIYSNVYLLCMLSIPLCLCLCYMSWSTLCWVRLLWWVVH